MIDGLYFTPIFHGKTNRVSRKYMVNGCFCFISLLDKSFSVTVTFFRCRLWGAYSFIFHYNIMSSWDCVYCVWARKDAVTTQHVQGLTPHSLLTLITSPSPEKIRADADTLLAANLCKNGNKMKMHNNKYCKKCPKHRKET